MKLLDSERQLLQNVAFSLSEEIDIFYCQEIIGDKTLFSLETLKDRIIQCVEKLENMQSNHPAFSSSLQQLYLLIMGKYSHREEGISVSQKRHIACEAINQVSSISFLCHNLNSRLTELPLAANYSNENAVTMQLELEQQLRMILNILITVIL